jgi:glycosyltransferase involved in cell wall biosynthesis
LQDKARLEALGFRIADRITAPSRYVARLLEREYDVPAARISVVPNGVDSQRFHPSRAEHTERPSVAAVCRLTEQKGLEHLLDVTERVRSRVPNVLLRVAGAGNGRERLARGIAERGLSDSVRLVGYVPHHALPELYASSWVFVSTSVYEPFGLTTLEAMASGAAVVASPLGGASDFVHEGASGLLRLPQDTESFATAVASLLGDGALRGRLCAGAAARARELSWHRVAARFSEEYARALEAAP